MNFKKNKNSNKLVKIFSFIIIIFTVSICLNYNNLPQPHMESHGEILQTSAPTQVTGLTLQSLGTHYVEFEWNANPESDIMGYNIYKNGRIVDGGSQTECYLSDLNELTTYIFTVAAIDRNYVVGPQSDPLTVTTGNGFPSRPTGLIATYVSDNQIDINWNANPELDMDHYEGYISGSGIYETFETANTFYSLTNLKPGTSYSIYLEAVDTGGMSSEYCILDISTKPSQVTGLTLLDIGDHYVLFEWTANPEKNIFGYNIYQDGMQVSDGPQTDYFTDDLNETTTYIYTVSAVDKKNMEGPLSDPLSVTTRNGIPSQPTGLIATYVSEYQINISWNANPEPDIDHYEVTINGGLINKRFETTNTFYNFTNLNPGITYNIDIRVVDTGRLKSPESSIEVSTIERPSQVTGLTATSISDYEIKLNWTANPEPDVAYYNVYRDGMIINTSIIPSYIDSGLSLGTTFEYMISAVDDDDLEGVQSDLLSVTTTNAIPTQIIDLNALLISDSVIELSWMAFDEIDFDFYNIYQDGFWINKTSNTIFTVYGLDPMISYEYSISAVDTAGQEGFQSDLVSILPNVIPAQVIGLTASSAQNVISISWTSHTDADIDHYNIYCNGGLIATTTGTSYSHENLPDSTAYSYQISAVDTAGQEGAKSTSKSATTLPPIPGFMEPILIGTLGFSISFGIIFVLNNFHKKVKR